MTSESSPVIVLVGAAGGIGLAILERLRGRARAIAVVLDAQQASVAEQAGAWCSIQCDIGDADSVRLALAELAVAIPASGLSGVIHTAALQPLGACELLPRQALERLYAVNVFGTLQLVQGLIPALRKARGRVVIFSSLAGRVSSPMLAAYASSKHALEALADALRRELLPDGIAVSLIEPGGVSTPMAAAQSSLVKRGYEGLTEEQRALYGPMYLGYGAMAGKALRYASKAEVVADTAIRAALGSGRARPRYVVGLDARLMILLARLLPVRWLDRILIRMTLAGGEAAR